MASQEHLLVEIERLERQIQETLDYVRRLRERAARSEKSKPVGRAASTLVNSVPTQEDVPTKEDAA